MRLLRRRRHGVVVVAHTHDLGDTGVDAVEAVDHGRLEPHRLRLASDVRPVGVADEPVGAAVDPDVEGERLEQRDRPRDEIGGDGAILDDAQVGLDDQPTVEGGDGRFEGERLDEHRHAARRPAAGHREPDPRLVELAHGVDRALAERLVRPDERPVDVGEHEADHFVAR